MSEMKIADILKQNIPEFQRGSKPLLEYLDAAGEFLDEAKQAIVDFDNLYDYKNGSDVNVEHTLDDRGYNIPSRINEVSKRRVLRDISELFLKNGTMDALEHAIRLAGLKPDIRIAWLPSPRAARRGFMVDPVTGVETRYDMDRFVYTEMLYGKPRATPDGVFFYGHRYTDVLQEEEIGPLPIIGERYKNIPDNLVEVSSTPYVVVRFDEGNTTVVTDPVYDPETGEVYEYSTSEAFDLINDVLQFLLKETHRPTTLRVVIIMYFMPFTDRMAFGIDEGTFTEKFIDMTPPEEDELVDVVESFGFINQFDPAAIRIGVHGHIGQVATPLMSRYIIVEGLRIGDDSGRYTELTYAPALSGETYHLAGKSTYHYPLRAQCSLSVTAPPDTSITVQGYMGNDDTNAVTIATVPAGATRTITPPLQYDVAKFVYSKVLTQDVQVSFSLSQYGSV